MFTVCKFNWCWFCLFIWLSHISNHTDKCRFTKSLDNVTWIGVFRVPSTFRKMKVRPKFPKLRPKCKTSDIRKQLKGVLTKKLLILLCDLGLALSVFPNSLNSHWVYFENWIALCTTPCSQIIFVFFFSHPENFAFFSHSSLNLHQWGQLKSFTTYIHFIL